MKEQVHVIERLVKGTKCKDCVSFRECARDATLPAFETGQAALCKGFAPRKPQTNADRIRAMSDEELVVFLTHINPTNCKDCAFSYGWRCQPDRDDYSDFEKCEEGRKRWLQQPAEEDDYA